MIYQPFRRRYGYGAARVLIRTHPYRPERPHTLRDGVDLAKSKLADRRASGRLVGRSAGLLALAVLVVAVLASVNQQTDP